MTDKEFVDQILLGDEQAWHRFVEKYSDFVFYVARIWTRWDTTCAHESEIRRLKDEKTGKIIEYSEETIKAYEWLLRQINNKIKSYNGLVPLNDFLWSKLNSPNLFKDYLRHIHGRADVLPIVIQQEPAVVQLIFKYWRMKKGDEQILRKFRRKHKTELSLEELWKIKNHILEILNKAGLPDFIESPVMKPIPDEFSEIISKEVEERLIDNLTLNQCLQKLAPEEWQIIKLHYYLDFSVNQIVEMYKRVDRKFMGRIKSKDLTVNILHKYKEKILTKLRKYVLDNPLDQDVKLEVS